jgi:pimeloyl-ACP methyl ester carboxylesterase
MTTLVLLPGMDGTGTLFEPLIEALSDDLPFMVVRYPSSEPLGYDALTDFADARLPADEPLVLLGESFSGPIAISLAARHPTRIKAVVLCCTFARNPRPILSPFKLFASLVPVKQLPTSLACVALLGQHATPKLRVALQTALAGVSAGALRERIKAALSVDVTSTLARLTAPILYLRASEDRLIPGRASALIQSIQPSTRLVQIAGPHCLLQAAPVEAARALQEFMHSLRVAS